MQFCRECGTRMVGVMSFSKDKDERFSRCPKCYSETKHKKIDKSMISFGEVLHRAMNNRK